MRTAGKSGIKIDIKMTQCVYQPIKIQQPPTESEFIKTNSEPIAQGDHFTYLGSGGLSTVNTQKKL